MSRIAHRLPTSSQELLLKAALLEGERALPAWKRWKATETITETDHESGRLFPLLARNLLRIGVEDPDLYILKNAYRHQWLVSQQRIAAGARALSALSQAGIETMVLKGAALAHRYYKDLGVRLMYDVDILVRPQSARLAAEVLLSSGWTQLLPLDLDVLLPVSHGTMFRDGKHGVDLHWYATWAPASEDDFWSAAEPIEIGEARTLAQCPADQLLHMCVHGIWTDGVPIRWVADAVTIIHSEPALDWDRLVDRGRARAVSLPLRDALTYLRNTFEAPVPGDVLRSLNRAPAGLLERVGHRAWQAPPTRLRMAWLAVERYRRQRPLPPGPAHERSLYHYLRAWLTMTMGLQAGAPLTPALARRLLPRST
jgi:Uncharacterised nucleotidyltransferase